MRGYWLVNSSDCHFFLKNLFRYQTDRRYIVYRYLVKILKTPNISNCKRGKANYASSRNERGYRTGRKHDSSIEKSFRIKIKHICHNTSTLYTHCTVGKVSSSSRFTFFVKTPNSPFCSSPLRKM